MSRVQLDRNAPRTPRFNMPFELGLTVGIRNPKHSWIVCETKKHRIKKSLSDIDGTDVYIHDGTVRGVFRDLCVVASAAADEIVLERAGVELPAATKPHSAQRFLLH